MNGSEYIALFLEKKKLQNVYLVTGGAIAFVVDSIGRKKYSSLHCFQHEQSASMAADTVWRVSKEKSVGVCMATSGPGAVNLLSGLGCSFVDSIPSICITGQVNIKESSKYGYANLRQAGYQEIDIVSMSKKVTKFSVQVNSANELKYNLAKAYHEATTGRKGPVLIDVPMDIQQIEVGEYEDFNFYNDSEMSELLLESDKLKIGDFFKDSKRPLILFGAGVGLAGVEDKLMDWINKNNIPFVASWSAFSYFDHTNDNYFGHIGVYGNRGANFILQNSDALLVLGSRLDNRQRTSNPAMFAPEAKKLVIDIDNEEIRKYHNDNYITINSNLTKSIDTIVNMKKPKLNNQWLDYVKDIKEQYFGKDISTAYKKNNSLSPYKVVSKLQEKMTDDSVVLSDCGAHLCWLYQSFIRQKETIFTAAGFGPIGYSIPAAIGAATSNPDAHIISFSGDGSFQVQTSELQVMKSLNLNICNIIMNDKGYGIVKQFQDSYMNSRYFAAGIKDGYSVPDFEKVSNAYGLKYLKIESMEQLESFEFDIEGPSVVEIVLEENILIEPKLEMKRPLCDQFPYMSDDEFYRNNKFVKFERVKSVDSSKAENHE